MRRSTLASSISETAVALFGLINFIVEQQIRRPREIDALYELLPEAKRKGIEDRDAKKD
jgi:hypothetical protein